MGRKLKFSEMVRMKKKTIKQKFKKYYFHKKKVFRFIIADRQGRENHFQLSNNGKICQIMEKNISGLFISKICFTNFTDTKK